MGVIKKEGINHSAIIYIGVLIGALNTMYIYPKYFDPEHLGLFRFLMDASVLIFPIISLGVHNLSVRMFPVFKSEKNGHNGLLGLMVIGASVGLICFLLFSYFFESYIVDYLKEESILIQKYWYFVIPLTGFSIYSIIANLYVLNFKKVLIPSIFIEIYIKIGLPLIGILIYFEKLTLTEGLYLLVGIYLLQFLSFYAYIYLIKQWHWRPNWKMLKPPLVKEMVEYSLYGILGSLGSLVANRIDVLMVGFLAFNTLEDVAVYAIAAFIANIITVPARAITYIASPVLAESWKNNDLENIKDIYSKSSIVLMTVGALVFIGIWCSVDDLFILMPRGEFYSQGKYVIFILGIGKLVDLATGANEQIISYSKYFRFNFYAVLILAVMNIIANFVFIPIYQINGAALATMSSLVVFNISKLIYINYKMKIQPFSWDTVKVLLIGSLVMVVGLSIPSIQMPFVDIIIRSLIISVLYISMALFFNVSQDLNNLFYQMVDKVKKVINH